MILNYFFKKTFILKKINVNFSLKFYFIWILINFFIFFKQIFNILKNYLGIFIISKSIFGSYFSNFFLQNFFYIIFYLGLLVNIKYLKKRSYFSNFFNFNLKKKKLFIKTNGTYGKVLFKRKNFFCLKLPSQKKIFLNSFYFCIIGRNSNIFWKYINKKLAKNRIYFKKKIQVKGTIQNPVDHPQGGKSKSKTPEKSIWGWIAKFSH